MLLPLAVDTTAVPKLLAFRLSVVALGPEELNVMVLLPVTLTFMDVLPVDPDATVVELPEGDLMSRLVVPGEVTDMVVLEPVVLRLVPPALNRLRVGVLRERFRAELIV
jgi:hypothetical protein